MCELVLSGACGDSHRGSIGPMCVVWVTITCGTCGWRLTPLNGDHRAMMPKPICTYAYCLGLLFIPCSSLLPAGGHETVVLGPAAFNIE
jgi:hypothetical protein